ncbi:MAG: phenylalanine--tRNA ligase subunit alpha [Nannocystaceae bacterium]
MPQRIVEQVESFRAELKLVAAETELYALQVRYLGKKGSLTRIRKSMAPLSPSDRRVFGQAFNHAKQEIEAELKARGKVLQGQLRAKDLERSEDLTAASRRMSLGTLHPVTRTRHLLEDACRNLGFDVLDGPHIEHGVYNFDMLNFPPDHPARDEHDTFFVDATGPAQIVLRTHTSPVQVRTMLRERPPVRIVAPGTVFRQDDDATHSPMFNQIEGLYVDRGVTFADLKATLYALFSGFFGKELQVRFRPSYFPFVEPGAEFDMQCPFCVRAGKGRTCSTCRGGGWIELGGAGMVHPAVFESVGYDPDEYSGWAFGFGIDRVAMLRHDVRDLRLFFENDLRFLEQFPC